MTIALVVIATLNFAIGIVEGLLWEHWEKGTFYLALAITLLIITKETA